MKSLCARLVTSALFSIAAVLLCTADANAATLLVPSEYPTIQGAITASVAGDTIIVAAGTYRESLTWSGKNLTIQGAGEGLSIIDPSAANGGPGGRCLALQSLTTASRIEGFTFQNGMASTGGGVFVGSSPVTVMNCTFANNSSTTDGGGLSSSGHLKLTNCTFTNNTATRNGGGMDIYNGAPTLTNCIFTNNVAGVEGGAMDVYFASPTLTDCAFTSNTAHEGGGMFNLRSSPKMTNCTFTGNQADLGGGMRNHDVSSQPSLTNCTFTNNTADGGGGIYNMSSPLTVTSCTFTGNQAIDGGGIYCYRTTLTVTNSDFINNTATGLGGGFFGDFSNMRATDCFFSSNTATKGGGGVCDYDGIVSTYANCLFTQNIAASSGGGIYSAWSTAGPRVTNCTFRGNEATTGGGISNYNNNPTVTNCSFINNMASNSGGGIFNDSYQNSGGANSFPKLFNCAFSNNTARFTGGGISNENQNQTVTNCTFSNNTATSYRGGAINQSGNGVTQFTNGIVWGNQSATLPAIAGLATVANSLVQGFPNTLPDANGNFAANPLFVNAANGDLRLLPASPAINAGSLAALPLDTQDLDSDGNKTELLPYDLNGNARVVQGIPDLGAFEDQTVLDATNNIQITRGGLRRNNATGRYSQTITLKNIGTSSVPGPLSLVLDGLSTGVALFNVTGTTSDTLSPYLNAAGTLAPGESVTLTLEFTNPASKAINYTTRILAGDGIR